MLVGSLSNEGNFFREVSLRREIFTVTWRYWITLVVWFGWGAWVECQLFFCFFFFWRDFLSDSSDSRTVTLFSRRRLAKLSEPLKEVDAKFCHLQSLLC
jgi:hypothetical protein